MAASHASPTEAYARSAESAVEYISQRLFDPAWVEGHDDVAYYFKAPLALLYSGSRELAEQSLEIVERYADQGGIGSQNGAYSTMYPHYPWMWMCWAAEQLNHSELLEKSWRNLCQYMEPEMCYGLVSTPYQSGEEYAADFFATAEIVKAGIAAGRLEVAEAAADALVEVVQCNRGHMAEGRFYFRWTGEVLEEGEDGSQRPRVKLMPVDDCWCSLHQAGDAGQLFFLMAFPVMVLTELSVELTSKKPDASEMYHSVAEQLLEFLRGCNGVFESPWSHKFAVAAAMLGDMDSAARVADYFVGQQQAAGCYQEDPEAMDCMDQSAEIAFWLYIVHQRLHQRD